MFLNLLSSLSLRCSAFPQHFNLFLVYLTSGSGCDLLTHIFFYRKHPPERPHRQRHDETLPLISKFLLQKLSCWICKLTYFVFDDIFLHSSAGAFQHFLNWFNHLHRNDREKVRIGLLGVLNRQVMGTDCLTLSRCSRLSIKKTTKHSLELQ